MNLADPRTQYRLTTMRLQSIPAIRRFFFCRRGDRSCRSRQTRGSHSRIREGNRDRPEYAKAFYNMGISLYKSGGMKRLLEPSNRPMPSILLIPGSGITARSSLSNRNGTLLRAAEATGTLLASEPDHADIWVIRGTAQYKIKRYGDAVASLDHAIKPDPLAPDAWLYKGFSLYEMEQYRTPHLHAG